MSWVKVMRAGEQLAQDHRRPAGREDLAGDGDGTELTKALVHGATLARGTANDKFSS